MRAGQRQHIRGDAAFLDPVSVKVEQPVLEVQHRRIGAQRAGRHRGHEIGRRGPGQRGNGGLLGDLREVDAHRSAPDRANGEGDSQRNPLIGFFGEFGQPLGHQHISRFDHPGVVELAQQSGGRRTAPPVRVVGHLDDHGAAFRPSSRSDSATTSAAGGRQLNTPAGWPSVSGVSGPHIPRTNR